jgi:glycosyltransferase involved in cell wall biosynthesis
MIEAIGVIVPVHDEEQHLGACLASLRTACRALPSCVKTHVVVVLDACTDRSAEIAAGELDDLGEALTVSDRNVGRARHVGARYAEARFASVSPARLWLATTDADSRVPPTWLVDQLALADSGVDAVAGTILITDWEDFPTARVRAFLEFYTPPGCSDDHDHVHGTNLGIRADAYEAAGGFADLETGEDHALWNALRGKGRRLVSTRRLPVATSARRDGRAPRGFAAFLTSFRCGEMA